MNLIQAAQELLSIKLNYSFYLDYDKLSEQNIKKVDDNDFDIHIFEQMWGNTSGGFEGIGGSAMTVQTTYVLIPKFDHDCLVYFGGKFAYKVPYSQKFMADVMAKNIKGKNSKDYYIG